MKNVVLIVLAVTVVALGALSLHQARELRQIRNQRDVASAESQTSEKQTQDTAAAEEKAALAEAQAKSLQETLTQSSAEAARQSQQVVALKGQLEAERTNSPEAGMARLLSSPEMRKTMQQQRQVFLDPMLDRTYGALFDQLHLNAEQAGALKELLKQREIAESEKDMSMLEPNMDLSKRRDVAEEIKKEKEGYNDQIRQFLGDEGYKEFEAYDKTAGDRNTVNQFASQMEGEGTDLNAAQREQLIQTLYDERGRFNWSIDIGQVNSGTADYSQLTDEQLNQYANEREQFNALILERARQFLTPEQLPSLEKTKFQPRIHIDKQDEKRDTNLHDLARTRRTELTEGNKANKGGGTWQEDGKRMGASE
jgi:hypothetical protein